MKHLLVIFNLILCSSIYGQNDSTSKFSTGIFPEQWDTNMNLRSNNEIVLAWHHKIDHRPLEVKSCILLTIYTDSFGQIEYLFSEKYTNQKPFTNWNWASIHYGPAPDLVWGFDNMHLESFDHKPTENEIYDLLNSWDFKFQEEGWYTIESGLDEQLWLTTFGFKPDQRFIIK